MKRTWIAGLSLLFLPLALTAGAGTAYAGGATLYELTENMKLNGLKDGSAERRLATSALSGSADAGTPLCPFPAGSKPCSINAMGSDDIDVGTGLGGFKGTVTTVVQGDNPTDGPEYVVLRGKFHGKMDFSPALVQGQPYGTVTGEMSINGNSYKFTGTFYLPFMMPDGTGPMYLTGPVQEFEKLFGWPMVKFQIQF
jgi:hypothetical protein